MSTSDHPPDLRVDPGGLRDAGRHLQQRPGFLDPIPIDPAAPLADAIEILSRHRISELPVIDAAGQPVGLIDITDVIGLMPEET